MVLMVFKVPNFSKFLKFTKILYECANKRKKAQCYY